MATQQTSPSGWSFERLVAHEQRIGYGLVAAGVLLLAIPIANFVRYRTDSLAVLIWGGLLALFVLGVGIYTLTMPSLADDLQKRAERLRWVFLLTAGGVGALTALLGFVLPFCTMPMAMTNYPEIFRSGPKMWRDKENALAISRCFGALIGGLVLMFVGLQLARPVQRTSMNMRRWLYGYNAVLSSLLLLFILVLVNMLPYTGVKPFTWAMEATDWTKDRLYTLHSATKNLLTEIKEPVKVYVLMPEGHPLTRQTETLLNNCRGLNSQFTWEEWSPDQNRNVVDKLVQQYQLPEREGLLVVYGTPPNDTNQFIKFEELFSASSTGQRDRSFDFKGESALLNALTFLSSGKSRAVVYFTQGNGELDFNDSNRNQTDVGVGMLKEELNKINYQTHALPLDAKTTSIPEDADIVVIAGPHEEFPPNAIKALRDFLQGEHRKDKRKGKAIVLSDVTIRKGQMVRTGLEPLLAEYGVKLADNRLLSARSRNPLNVTVIPDPRSTCPVARAFIQHGQLTALFTFSDARTVESMSRPGGAYTVDNLVVTLPQTYVWPETDLKADPVELTNQLLRNQQKLREKIVATPIPVGAAVSEGKTAAPPIPGHESLAKEGEPRLVVFGDASWVSNRLFQDNSPDHFSLFSSCLSWLSGRHDIGERIPASTRNFYRLKVEPGETSRLLLLPGVLMLFGVVALGAGVWVVRRR